MSDRFRASQGHLSCVLAVAIVVVFLIPQPPALRRSRLRQGVLRAAQPQPVKPGFRGPSPRTENARTQGSVGQAAQ